MDDWQGKLSVKTQIKQPGGSILMADRGSKLMAVDTRVAGEVPVIRLFTILRLEYAVNAASQAEPPLIIERGGALAL